jgi:protein gp37
MAETTKIAWTNRTFNIAWGCFKVSPGCKNCYADTLSARYGQSNIWGPPATTGRRTFGDKHWNEPERWNAQAEKLGQRQRVFSSSMCDVFEDHPTIAQEREKLWALIERTPWLDWQLLTKRADRIAANLPANWDRIRWHVWLGVSIESNEYVWRAAHLRALHADPSRRPSVTFVSYEPALGPLDQLELDGLDWIIFGGESGPGYRPMDVQWARDMRDRCRSAGVAFFFKQSAAPRTEMGIQLDGEIVREYPALEAAISERHA